MTPEKPKELIPEEMLVARYYFDYHDEGPVLRGRIMAYRYGPWWYYYQDWDEDSRKYEARRSSWYAEFEHLTEVLEAGKGYRVQIVLKALTARQHPKPVTKDLAEKLYKIVEDGFSLKTFGGKEESDLYFRVDKALEDARRQES